MCFRQVSVLSIKVNYDSNYFLEKHAVTIPFLLDTGVSNSDGATISTH